MGSPQIGALRTLLDRKLIREAGRKLRPQADRSSTRPRRIFCITSASTRSTSFPRSKTSNRWKRNESMCSTRWKPPLDLPNLVVT